MTSPLQIIVGIILVVLIAVVIVGGIKVISRVCEKLIPAMTIFYVLACLVLIIINGQYFLDAIGLIVVCAFTPQAAFGGAVGTSIMIALRLVARVVSSPTNLAWALLHSLLLRLSHATLRVRRSFP